MTNEKYQTTLFPYVKVFALVFCLTVFILLFGVVVIRRTFVCLYCYRLQVFAQVPVCSELCVKDTITHFRSLVLNGV